MGLLRRGRGPGYTGPPSFRPREKGSGIDVLESVLGLRVGAGLGEVDRGVDELLHFPVERLVVGVGQTEFLPQELDWIGRFLKPVELLLVPIDLWIADVVTDEALGFAAQVSR